MIAGQLKRVVELTNSFPQSQEVKKNIFSFISGKGGTGKSVLSLMTSMSLAKSKKRVLLIDLDLGFPNLNVLLNQQAIKSLDDYCFRNENLSDIITEIDDNFQIIYGLSENPLNLNFTKHVLKSLLIDIKKMSNKYDFILLDLGGGIDEFKLNVLKISAGKIIVSNSEPSSIMDAYALIKIYEKSEEFSDFLILINRCSDIEEGKESFQKLKKAVQSFLKSKIELLTVVPEMKDIKNAAFEQNFAEIFNEKSTSLDNLQADLLKLNKYVQLHNINQSVNF